MWTLTEYFYHRFSAHHKIDKKGDYPDHMIHHAFPNLPNRIVISFWADGLILILIFGATRCVFEYMSALMFMMGYMSYMVLYDVLHYSCHFAPETNIRWLKRLRIKHQKHHFRNPNANFGVTTSLWDSLFATDD